MLKESFIALLKSYTSDTNLVHKYWHEIEEAYSQKGRHYHTLAHLENMLVELNNIKTEIQDWDTVLFSLYYHDVVYNVLKSDNEEQSADLAQKRMQAIEVLAPIIDTCHTQIIATKKHALSDNTDTNYFTDTDLSILGKAPETYTLYTQQVRKEYSIYPDLLYKPGRKKVLRHFLDMDRIFKTDYFFNKYESAAKKNLQIELETL